MFPTALSEPIAFSPARLLHLLPSPLAHGRRSPPTGHYHHHLLPPPSAYTVPTSSVAVGQSTAKTDLFASARLPGLRARARGTPTQKLPFVSRFLGVRKWAAAAASSHRGASGLGGDGATEMEAVQSVSSDGGGGGAGTIGRDLGQKEKGASSSSPGLLTLPTVLTLARVAAVPLLITVFYMDGRFATTATTSIFVAAAITDWLDGYIARKMKLRTIFGAFLDPVADKLMVATTLVLLCTRPLEVAIFGKVSWLLTVPAIAIIGREITMSAVREWAASQDSKVLEAVAVNNLGKWKTATQMASLTILLTSRDPSLLVSGLLTASGVFLLYISSGLAVWSLAVYMKNIWRVLFK